MMTQQAVHYEDQNAVEAALSLLQNFPPLVSEAEITTLKTQLAEAEAGRMFILQGGDCAEQFADCHPTQIANKFKILLQMSVILIHGLKKPVIRVGRIAGQYAKPRSSLWEIQGDKTLLAYRGDIINAPEFTEAARRPDPQRMLEAYYRSGLTLNYLRALLEGGFADLHHPENWELSFMKEGRGIEEYHQVLRDITESLSSFQSLVKGDSLSRVKLYTSHEALHLPYEAALTHQGYNLGVHFPWVGMRTLSLEGAHIQYLKGIANPIGIKVGPGADLSELCKIIEVLNPENESGKLMLIHRFGAEQINEKLPKLLRQMQGLPVFFSCDPMHGNTKITESKVKTRYFNDILAEVRAAFRIHQALDIPLSGIHFEMTGENVTECIGGATNLTEADLSRAYKSLVDPRLNYEQAMEMALCIAKID